METVIRIVNLQVPTGTAQMPAPQKPDGTPSLPEWCNVYAGLSDEEITEIEKTILQRADLSRPSE